MSDHAGLAESSAMSWGVALSCGVSVCCHLGARHTAWKVELRKHVMPRLMIPAGLCECRGVSGRGSSDDSRGVRAGDGIFDCGAERDMLERESY